MNKNRTLSAESLRIIFDAERSALIDTWRQNYQGSGKYQTLKDADPDAHAATMERHKKLQALSNWAIDTFMAQHAAAAGGEGER